MRAGVFGGTFNPPHMGHIEAAAAAAGQLGLGAVYFIPANVPPHKALPEGSATPAQRLEMAALAAALVPGGQACGIELERQGPSYTVDTIAALKALHPQDELWLIMGGDMLLSFDRWYCPKKIADMAGLAAVPRRRGEEQALEQKAGQLRASLGARIEVIGKPPLEISSTQVRVGQGMPNLPQAVAVYIVAHGLYSPQVRLAALRQVVALRLSNARLQHVLGTEEMAARLAQAHGEDVYEARVAALLHDITKEMPISGQLQLLANHDIIPNYSEDIMARILHADSGAIVAADEFGMPPRVCSAIACHSTGRPGMSRLDKIIYVADKIEESRTYADVPPVRALALRDLDGAVALVMRQTLGALERYGRQADPRTLRALEDINEGRQGQ